MLDMSIKKPVTCFDPEELCSLVFEIAVGLKRHPYYVLRDVKILSGMEQQNWDEMVKVMKRRSDEVPFSL